jgi:hypothetical protein
MYIATGILTGVLAFASLANASAAHLPKITEGASATFPLPASLDSFYPPVTDRPLYLLKMLDLDTSFSGIVVDLGENDLAGARGSFEDFQRHYRDVAGLVPEWTGAYPDGQVKELGAALLAGDTGRAMTAFAAVGGICHQCHVQTMVSVQQKYHWGNFAALTAQDLTSATATGYAQFKQRLAANLAGITVDLRQGQTDNARRQFEGFRARFTALGGSCQACHAKEPRYYVDRDMQDVVDELGKALTKQPIASQMVMELTQKIGRESCARCHRVHLPAAFAKRTGR